MNELPRAPKSRPTTQAAEGVPRLRWTLDEFERLIELGIFGKDDRIELIRGELVPMAAKGNRHELVRDELLNWLIEHKPADVRLCSEIGWRPSGADTYVEPDLLICPKTFKGITVPPAEVLLAIEVADTSERFDTTAKAKLYGSLGVREYWVVNARTLSTRVHREPGAAGYSSVADVAPTEVVQSTFVPSLGLKLADLPLE